ncbi:MAG: hypothetical protein ACI9Y8_001001, partial [Candidatus Omnitrophota bacterium]
SAKRRRKKSNMAMCMALVGITTSFKLKDKLV